MVHDGTNQKKADQEHMDEAKIIESPNDNRAGFGLAVDGGYSMPKNCAFELFSMYVFDIASRIGENLAPSSSKYNKVTKSDKYTNEAVEEMAEIVVNSGLTTLMEEARTLIVPSFFYFGLLKRPASVKVWTTLLMG